MHTLRTLTTRGAAAALLSLGWAAVPLARAGAQSVGTVQPRRDTIFMRVAAPSKVQIDSLHALMRQLEELSPDSPARVLLLRQMDQLMPNIAQARIMVRKQEAGPPPVLKGWIGLNVMGPHLEMVDADRFLVEYLDHPSVTSVDPDSPAQRAGIAPGDVLLAYDGNDVLGHRFDLTELLVPEKKLAVTVRRDGDTKEYTVIVAPTPIGIMARRRDLVAASGSGQITRVIRPGDEPSRVGVSALPHGGFGGNVVLFNRRVLLTPNGAFGAVMSTVSPELAKTLKLETGVLVNDVTDDTPASRAGLRPGDVIVRVAGQPVASLKSLQEGVLRAGEPSVALQVMRDRKSRSITVSW